MWSSSLPPASPSTVNDPVQPWDTPADAVPAAASRSLGLHHCSAAIQTCGREIEQAKHLSASTKNGALQLLTTLATQGCVEVSEGPEQRKEVGAIQWAMERTLPGTEVIMTPARPTPFRTYGQEGVDPAQAARADALTARFHRNERLCLVFCHPEKASQDPDPVYCKEILKPAQAAGLPLVEIWLGPQAHFPQELSGAFILSPHGPAPAIFAVRAAQVDKPDKNKALTLWWAQAPSLSGPAGTAVPSAGSGSMAAADGVMRPPVSPAFQKVLDDWYSYLSSPGMLPITQELGPHAAMMTRGDDGV